MFELTSIHVQVYAKDARTAAWKPLLMPDETSSRSVP